MIRILWDGAHIWGLMARRALRGLGLPARLVKAQEITQGALSGKPGRGRTRLLLVPGGSAREKGRALGQDGAAALRAWLAGGGAYLGFCGGAGLALSEGGGLAICPWRRAPYASRLQHLVSGHLRASLATGGDLSPAAAPSADLPVWWPGRFAAEPAPGIDVLARAEGPGADAWLADLPLSGLPGRLMRRWREEGLLDLSYLRGQPLVISGSYGRGRYLLSYSHLETPGSPAANAWLARILGNLAGLEPAGAVPEWRPLAAPADFAVWEDGAVLAEALEGVRDIFRLGVRLRLMFRRTPWLWGWRKNFHGMSCNNLHLALCELAETVPSREAGALWRQARGNFAARWREFFARAAEEMWTARVCSTIGDGGGAVLAGRPVFGHPMQGGGLIGGLVRLLEEMLYLSDRAGTHAE